MISNYDENETKRVRTMYALSCCIYIMLSLIAIGDLWLVAIGTLPLIGGVIVFLTLLLCGWLESHVAFKFQR